MGSLSSPEFPTVAPEDEFLHAVSADAHYTALETNLYGFNCPDVGLDGELYAWYHPALKVMGFMIYVFRGRNNHQLEAEYFNEYVYLPMIGSNADYRLEMGTCNLHVRVIDPLKRIVIEVEDVPRGLSLHLVTCGVSPPVGRPGGGHFTQLMENQGTLCLKGTTYEIAGWSIRDRSWSQNRPEHIQPGPPANWMTGWFGRDLAFHASILDTSLISLPEYGPDWREHFNIQHVVKSMKWESGGNHTDTNLRGGWWQKCSDVYGLLSVDAQTTCFPGTMTPEQVVLSIRDKNGGCHLLKGETLSHVPKLHGQNVLCHICFVKWRYGDRIGYGEVMAVYDNEHLYRVKRMEELKS